MSILACSLLFRDPFFLSVCLWLEGNGYFSPLTFLCVPSLPSTQRIVFFLIASADGSKGSPDDSIVLVCQSRVETVPFATAASLFLYSIVSLGKLILGKQVPKRKGSSIIFAQNWQPFFFFPFFFLDISSLHNIPELWLARTFMCVKLIFVRVCGLDSIFF